MAIEKTDAIILRVVPFSETSVVVTMLSRDFGKFGALAKGAYRPKSPFEGALDLGCLCCVVFIPKPSDALHILTEAKLQRRFRAGGKSLEQLYAGYYVLELLREMTGDGENNSKLFDLAANTIDMIDREEQSRERLADLIASFELKALSLLGHAPSLKDCAACGSEVPCTNRVSFGMLSGGVLCQDCRHGAKQVVSISKQSRESMMERSNDCIETNDDLHRTPIHGEMRGLLSRYMSHHTGKALRMHKLIASLVTSG